MTTLGLSPVPPQRMAPVVIPSHVPVYRVGHGKFFGPDDHLHPEGSIIVWPGEPNQDMEPLNELAQKNYTAYLDKLDKLGREAAEKASTAYTSLADAHQNAIALAQQDARAVTVLNGNGNQVPLMGAKRTKRVEQINMDGAAPATIVDLTPPRQQEKKADADDGSDDGKGGDDDKKSDPSIKHDNKSDSQKKASERAKGLL